MWTQDETSHFRIFRYVVRSYGAVLHHISNGGGAESAMRDFLTRNEKDVEELLICADVDFARCANKRWPIEFLVALVHDSWIRWALLA